MAVHRALDNAALPHAFGGALALAWCTQRARGTIYIDVNVFVPVARVGDLLAALPAEVVEDVVDVGAPLSHAIIVSRELGLPCVISVTDATTTIPDGAIIEVDGNTGTVTVVEVP